MTIYTVEEVRRADKTREHEGCIGKCHSVTIDIIHYGATHRYCGLQPVALSAIMPSCDDHPACVRTGGRRARGGQPGTVPAISSSRPPVMVRTSRSGIRRVYDGPPDIRPYAVKFIRSFGRGARRPTNRPTDRGPGCR
jgi:hypothetical protein